MISAVATIAALLAAGYGFGRARQRFQVSADHARSAARPKSRTATLAVLVVLGFPVVTMLLAQLFDSNVLGWIFGLTLMLMAALVPCAAIFWAGMKLGTRPAAKRVAPVASNASAALQESHAIKAASPAPDAMLTVDIQRDSVHASDDDPSQFRQVRVARASSLRTLVELGMAQGYLPGISGGRATWIIESSGAGSLPIAVCAQQWAEPMFLISADTSVAAHFSGATPRLYFRYRSQIDPHAVLASLSLARRS